MDPSENPPAPAPTPALAPVQGQQSEEEHIASDVATTSGIDAAPPATAVDDVKSQERDAQLRTEPESTLQWEMDELPLIHAPPEHQSAGIEPVAAFLPKDAVINRPTPSPTEPLGNGATDHQDDAEMTDATAVPPQSDSQPTVPTPAVDGPVIAEPVQQHTPASEAELAKPYTNGMMPDVTAQASGSEGIIDAAAPPITGGDAVTLPSQISADSSVAQPPTGTEREIKMETAADSGEASVSTNPPPVSMPAPVNTSVSQQSQTDTEMKDSSAASLTRSRDEEEYTDEPSAKRAKLEDSVNESKPPIASEDFKRPTLPVVAPPAAAPPAAPATPVNGTATGHLPARASYSTEPLTKVQKKVLEEKLKNTKKVKSANPFLRPVDPVALNIPSYPTIVKTPMDLGTMEHKLKTDQYSSLEGFVSDFELLVNNCFTFNGPAHAVSGMAMNLRAYFLKQMDGVPTGDAATVVQKPAKKGSPAAKPQPRRESRASAGPGTTVPPVTAVAAPPTAPPTGARSPGANDTFALLPGGTPQIRRDSNAGRPKRTVVPPAPRDLPYSGAKPKRKENQAGLKFCEWLLDEIRKPKYDPMTVFFREPVDPVALNIPNYFQVIKHPMDLSTIAKKLKNGQYSSAEEVKADLDLMLSNCFKFNPPDNGVHIKGKELSYEIGQLWQKKNDWIKKNQPRSQRQTPGSDAESEEQDESSDEEQQDAEEAAKDAQIRALQEQLATMQNMLGQIAGGKRESPKASGKKKNRSSSSASKPKKGTAASAPKATAKPKAPKKMRLVTWEEKQEISNATENMTEAQVGKLTSIITENVAKYKNMAGDDVELEIDDLPNEVQHKLLKYVRTIFPRQQREEEEVGVDDDYEPEKGSKGGRKKHKPMKKQEQESRIAQLSAKVEAMKGGLGGSSSAPAAAESSDDEDSESSEEE